MAVVVSTEVQRRIVPMLQAYCDKGEIPGGFLTAVLSNQLFQAFAAADEFNGQHIAEIVVWIYNNLPAGCWGSPSRVSDWAQHSGLLNIEPAGVM